MNLKRYVKYAGYIAVISCVTLLSENLISYNNMLDKSNVAMVNSLERDNLVEGFTNDNGTRVAVPSTNDNLKVQPLPPADANHQIIIDLLQ